MLDPFEPPCNNFFIYISQERGRTSRGDSKIPTRFTPPKNPYLMLPNSEHLLKKGENFKGGGGIKTLKGKEIK